jgi:hypothetical protein
MILHISWLTSNISYIVWINKKILMLIFNIVIYLQLIIIYIKYILIHIKLGINICENIDTYHGRII